MNSSGSTATRLRPFLELRDELASALMAVSMNTTLLLESLPATGRVLQLAMNTQAASQEALDIFKEIFNGAYPEEQVSILDPAPIQPTESLQQEPLPRLGSTQAEGKSDNEGGIHTLPERIP